LPLVAAASTGEKEIVGEKEIKFLKKKKEIRKKEKSKSRGALSYPRKLTPVEEEKK